MQDPFGVVCHSAVQALIRMLPLAGDSWMRIGGGGHIKAGGASAIHACVRIGPLPNRYVACWSNVRLV